eukprot:Phypoly_transcript_10990.p1 GENE.Phypoly_transcript_10990~~Phypoly_transcript_10990.p1  ORF type:complete len:243 (+),score=8.39 Phypoly_transcript_10990:67-795(+)
MVTGTEIEIAFLSVSCFAATLAIIVKIIQRKEVFAKCNISARLLLCLAISDLIGSGGWLLQVWIRSCPLLMIFNYFGAIAANFFTNAVGFHLVAKMQAIQVRNRWFFIFPFCGSSTLVLVWLGLHAYQPIDSPIEKCWLIRPTYDLIFSKGIDFLVFGINVVSFRWLDYYGTIFNLFFFVLSYKKMFLMSYVLICSVLTVALFSFVFCLWVTSFYCAVRFYLFYFVLLFYFYFYFYFYFMVF